MNLEGLGDEIQRHYLLVRERNLFFLKNDFVKNKLIFDSLIKNKLKYIF
jgi:hypothetical protein